MRKKFFFIGLISFLVIVVASFSGIIFFRIFSFLPMEISKENFTKRKEGPDCSILFNNATSYQIKVLNSVEPTYFCFFSLENDKAQDFIKVNGLIPINGMEKLKKLDDFHRGVKKFNTHRIFFNNYTTQIYYLNTPEKGYWVIVGIEKQDSNNNVYMLIQVT